jgi:hypothetical protein
MNSIIKNITLSHRAIGKVFKLSRLGKVPPAAVTRIAEEREDRNLGSMGEIISERLLHLHLHSRDPPNGLQKDLLGLLYIPNSTRNNMYLIHIISPSPAPAYKRDGDAWKSWDRGMMDNGRSTIAARDDRSP